MELGNRRFQVSTVIGTGPVFESKLNLGGVWLPDHIPNLVQTIKIYEDFYADDQPAELQRHK